MQTPSPVGWITSLGETLSARATSRDTALITPAISGLASLATTSIRHYHHRHPGHWPVGQTLSRLRTSLTILGCWAFHLNAATSTSPPPRSPTTSVFAGMHLWFGSPPI